MKPLDEAVWQAWIAKGRATERRSRAAALKVIKWASIVGLLAAAGLWSHLTPYEVVVRFLVAASAIVVMLQSFHEPRYVVAAGFGALALLYNPVVPVFAFSGDWQRVAWWRALFRSPRHSPGAMRGWPIMTKLGVVRSALMSFLALGVIPAATFAGDLSKYRDFQLGSDLATVAKQTGMTASHVKVVHSRPALIQELEWHPQPLGLSSKTEPVHDVVFGFHEGELFRIVVNYDRYETEGLTPDDIVEAFSATYGMGAKPPAPAKAAPGNYGDVEEVLVRWQDPQYRFDLIRSSYRPSFRLVGVLKRLEAPAQAAILEAARLDDKEAPQREAARLAREDETERAKLEKARLVNKPKFRP